MDRWYRETVLDGRWKTDIERRLRPVGVNLRRSGVTADRLTATGLVMAVGAAVAIANGALRAHDRSRVRIAVRLAAHAGAVGDARAHTGHRRAALRQGVAPGERAATRAGVPAVARAARGAPDRARVAPTGSHVPSVTDGH